MTPEAAVAHLVEILAKGGALTEDALYAALSTAGAPDPVADRAYKFTQIAWGRVLLEDLGIKLAPDYTCFNRSGEVIEAGLLAEQPYFVAAAAAAKRHPPPAGLPRFALMSSEVAAINQALSAGAKPEDLATEPPALFMEPPTPEGIAKAQQHIARQLSAQRASAGGPRTQVAPTRKPWWRFW
jgi:hypothetical protein